MKTPLLLLGICTTLCASAQVINEADTLSTGDMMTYYVMDSATTALPDVTGADVVWDYSNIAAYEIAPNDNEVIPAGDSDFSDDFPTATYAENFENSINTFFTNDDAGDQVIVEGFVFQELSNDFVIKYDIDPLISFQFPMNQGDTYMDDIDGTAIVPLAGEVAISGTATITADGTGTLKLGPTDYADVIRIHTIEISEGIILGSPATITRESYVYYAPGSFDLPIFIHGRVLAELGAGGDFGFTAVYSKDEITDYVGIEETVEAPLSLSVYPNPVLGNEVIVSTDQNTSSIVVLNAIGQEVVRVNNPSTTENLDVSGLNNGVYFVQAVRGNATLTEKLIIK